MNVNEERQMKIAVVYASKHGTTEKVAREIARAADAEPIDLVEQPDPSLDGFDAIVVGGSVYAGQPTKALKNFLAAHQEVLLSKPLALFVCGMIPEAQKRAEEIAAVFPETLRKHALGCWFAGGEFRFDKLNFFERAIVKKICHIESSISALDPDVPGQIAQALQAVR
ncbi:MAG: flavodoxin domain-containing protein [Propionibacteriaceae bacterium]|jgi:menaquinone-dependent protoporphyrinogen oxidase|nr:flavodoxin domain-containing protein [Propionibacteriaceae bacterium]